MVLSRRRILFLNEFPPFPVLDRFRTSESIFQSDLNGSHRRTQRSDCSRSARSGVYVRVRQSEVQMIQVKLPAKLNFLPFGHREDFSNPEVQVPQTGPDEDVISGGADV
jgi:hypothetical protein